ncbi:MAG: aminoglycoside phosphotransferase family protein [bacterium]
MVRRLIDTQFPEWKGRSIRRVASAGTVNAIFRLGNDLAVRFPLNGTSPEQVAVFLENEAEASRELLGRVAVPTPEPVAIGQPGEGFPLPWSIQTWLPGRIATATAAASSDAFATDLAEFIAAVRAIDTRGRPFGGRGRGGEFPAHDTWLATCFDRSEGLLDVPPLRRLWARWRELPPAQTLAMTHGDLTPMNLLLRRGRLAGVLDTGGLAPTDPALDLVCAWHLLDAGPRQTLRDLLGCDDAEWERGAAWAFAQAMGLPWYYQHSNPQMAELGKTTLTRILESW